MVRLRAKKSRLLAPQVYFGGRGRFSVHEALGKLPRSADLVTPRLFLFSLALHSWASALQDVKDQHSHCSLNERCPQPGLLFMVAWQHPPCSKFYREFLWMPEWFS